jgi:hypothetical protein
MYRGRYRCCDRGLIPYGGYYPVVNPYYANPYLYQAYLNSNIYDYYPGILNPYYYY